MEAKCIPIEEIRSTLDRLRQDPKTQRKFPQELWTLIIQQTKIYPVEEVCRRLKINPINLRRRRSNFERLSCQQFNQPLIQSRLNSGLLTGYKLKFKAPSPA
jgi:hypothetical protein